MSVRSGRVVFRPCAVCGERGRLERAWRVGGYTIVRCGTCSLVYTNEVPSRRELDDIYASGFFDVGAKYAAAGPSSPGLLNARDRVRRLLALPEVGVASWLDVGCATGDFLVAARASVREVRGVELSPYAADIARARGLDVVAGDFLEVAIGGGAFDVVTMWDYLEHVPDPVATLAKAHRVLKPGGYLVISTGDVESAAAKILGRFWHLLIPPKHLYFFSPATLSRVLVQQGFVVLQIARPGKRVPLDFVVWKAAALTFPRLARPALAVARHVGLGRVAPVVNLHDIMTVVARKRSE